MRCAIVLLALAGGVFSGPIEDQALEEFVKGNLKFTAAVYKELIKSKTGNIIVSPLSAETVLAMTNEGAKGETFTEFVVGLSLPSTKEKTQKAFKSFLPKLKTAENDLKLLSANKIYAANDVTLDNDFKTVATTIYDSSIDNIDFSQNVQAAETINAWVEDHTNNKIKNLLKPDVIDGDTKLVLVNALYFSGKWVNKFESYETKKKKFYKTKEETVDVDTMHQVDYFRYYENPTLNAKFLELPYQGANISMVVVLPNEIDGLASLEQNIEQVLEPQPFTNERVDVDLPKFTIDTETKFIPILKALGIQKAFNGQADFSGLSSSHKNLVISEVIQKAFINVTETGTEAAAATAVFAPGTASMHFVKPVEPQKFHANHPFFYLIKYNEVVVFSGRHITSQ